MSSTLFNKKKYKKMKKFNEDIWGLSWRKQINDPKLWYDVFPLRRVVNKIIFAKRKYNFFDSGNIVRKIFSSSEFGDFFKQRDVEDRNTLALTTLPQKQLKYKRAIKLSHKEFNQKRMLRLFYINIKQKQLNNIFKKSKQSKYPLKVIDNVYCLLESRLDMILYRSLFSKSVPHARQMIKHGFIEVNGQKITHSNYTLKIGDMVSISEKKLEFCSEFLFNNFVENDNYSLLFFPKYLEVDYDNFRLILVEEPNKDNIYYPFKFDKDNIFGLFNK